MPWGRAFFDALAQGTVDGQENPIDDIVLNELFRWQKYLSLTGHIYSTGVIIMSMSAYDKLSAPDKPVVVESARHAVEMSRKAVDDADANGLAQLLSVGMKINNDVDKAAFRAALASDHAEWREQFGDLIERIQAYQ